MCNFIIYESDGERGIWTCIAAVRARFSLVCKVDKVDGPRPSPPVVCIPAQDNMSSSISVTQVSNAPALVSPTEGLAKVFDDISMVRYLLQRKRRTDSRSLYLKGLSQSHGDDQGRTDLCDCLTCIPCRRPLD